MRIAYTLEQCWHRVPGGTGVAAIEVARELTTMADVDLIGVAGRHRTPPTQGFAPPIATRNLLIGRPWLYQAWSRMNWPLVESVVENIDIVHTTTIIAPATRASLVATIHDLAFLRHPEFFTKNGNKVFRRSLEILLEKASLVLCSSQSTLNDCVDAGFRRDQLIHVPLGVTTHHISDRDRAVVRASYELPTRFVLFVGTLEPRKNLPRLLAAMKSISNGMPLVIAGMPGWGDNIPTIDYDVRFLGYVPQHLLPALYEAATVFAFPSILEGYGLPVIEAMAHGCAVVTSRGTSTEEVAGGAAVLVDPLDVTSIAQGIVEAVDRHEELAEMGRRHAAQATWRKTAEATVRAYKQVMDANA